MPCVWPSVNLMKIRKLVIIRRPDVLTKAKTSGPPDMSRIFNLEKLDAVQRPQHQGTPNGSAVGIGVTQTIGSTPGYVRHNLIRHLEAMNHKAAFNDSLSGENTQHDVLIPHDVLVNRLKSKGVGDEELAVYGLHPDQAHSLPAFGASDRANKEQSISDWLDFAKLRAPRFHVFDRQAHSSYSFHTKHIQGTSPKYTSASFSIQPRPESGFGINTQPLYGGGHYSSYDSHQIEHDGENFLPPSSYFSERDIENVMHHRYLDMTSADPKIGKVRSIWETQADPVQHALKAFAKDYRFHRNKDLDLSASPLPPLSQILWRKMDDPYRYEFMTDSRFRNPRIPLMAHYAGTSEQIGPNELLPWAVSKAIAEGVKTIRLPHPQMQNGDMYQLPVKFDEMRSQNPELYDGFEPGGRFYVRPTHRSPQPGAIFERYALQIKAAEALAKATGSDFSWTTLKSLFQNPSEKKLSVRDNPESPAFNIRTPFRPILAAMRNRLLELPLIHFLAHAEYRMGNDWHSAYEGTWDEEHSKPHWNYDAFVPPQLDRYSSDHVNWYGNRPTNAPIILPFIHGAKSALWHGHNYRENSYGYSVRHKDNPDFRPYEVPEDQPKTGTDGFVQSPKASIIPVRLNDGMVPKSPEEVIKDYVASLPSKEKNPRRRSNNNALRVSVHDVDQRVASDLNQGLRQVRRSALGGSRWSDLNPKEIASTTVDPSRQFGRSWFKNELDKIEEDDRAVSHMKISEGDVDHQPRFGVFRPKTTWLDMHGRLESIGGTHNSGRWAYSHGGGDVQTLDPAWVKKNVDNLADLWDQIPNPTPETHPELFDRANRPADPLIVRQWEKDRLRLKPQAIEADDDLSDSEKAEVIHDDPSVDRRHAVRWVLMRVEPPQWLKDHLESQYGRPDMLTYETLVPHSFVAPEGLSSEPTIEGYGMTSELDKWLRTNLGPYYKDAINAGAFPVAYNRQTEPRVFPLHRPEAAKGAKTQANKFMNIMLRAAKEPQSGGQHVFPQGAQSSGDAIPQATISVSDKLADQVNKRGWAPFVGLKDFIDADGYMKRVAKGIDMNEETERA